MLLQLKQLNDNQISRSTHWSATTKKLRTNQKLVNDFKKITYLCASLNQNFVEVFFDFVTALSIFWADHDMAIFFLPCKNHLDQSNWKGISYDEYLLHSPSWIQVWALAWPIKDLKFLLVKPLLSWFWYMFCILPNKLLHHEWCMELFNIPSTLTKALFPAEDAITTEFCHWYDG